MTKNAAWEPGSLTNGSLETLWQEWVSNETTKRFDFDLPLIYLLLNCSLQCNMVVLLA